MKNQALIIAEFTCLIIFLCISGCRKEENYPSTVTDIDGNVYQTVKIGSQVWMAENLKVTHYRNGDEILNILDGSIWVSLNTGAYCTYEHSPSNAAIYGNLYNWHAVNDPRKLAPEGWHIPSDEEWMILSDYLGEDIPGGKLKEADTTHWKYPNIGATNETGFTALPAGIRSTLEVGFTGLGLTTEWWAANLSDTYRQQSWEASYSNPKLTRKEWWPTFGLSVRCILD